MKRWFCLLLVLVLAASGAAALAEGDVLLGRDESLYVEGMFALDGALCIYGNDLYIYRPGEADYQTYSFDFSGLSEDESLSFERGIVFDDGGQLRGFTFALRYDDQFRGEIAKAFLGDIDLTAGGLAVMENAVEVEWPEELTERYDDGSEMPVSLSGTPFITGGTLYLNAYSGAYALDLETMEAGELAAEGDFYLSAMCPYTDGRALLYGYSNDLGGYALYACDAASGERELLSAVDSVPVAGDLSGLAADPETGAVWCAYDGQIYALDAATGQLGEPFGDMPLMTYGSNKACLFGGHYYAIESNGSILVRDLSRDVQPEAQLKVYDGRYLDSVTDAYFAYTAAHPEVSVTISHDYEAGSQILEDMLNRSAEYDIYILSTASPEYAALRDRGYLYDLSGSAAIAELFEGLYPAVAEHLSSNGAPAALPVEASVRGFCISDDALARIGLTAEDVPTNWSDFLDFLNELPQYMGEDAAVMAFEPYMSQEDVRSQLLGCILTSYQAYSDATADVPSIDTPLMRELLDKLERVDFGALGVPEKVVGDSFSWSSEELLFTTDADVTLGDNYFYRETPVIMAMGSEEPPVLAMEVTAAFVNPFSENAGLAVGFLESLAGSVPEDVWYNFCPDKNDPLPAPERDELIAGAQRYYDQTVAAYEAADAADKQALKQEMDSAEENLEQVTEYSWAIRPEQIEWFRANDDHLTAMGESWFVDEGEELTMQYIQGRLDAGQYLRQMENKVRMRAMEGM